MQTNVYAYEVYDPLCLFISLSIYIYIYADIKCLSYQPLKQSRKEQLHSKGGVNNSIA